MNKLLDIITDPVKSFVLFGALLLITMGMIIVVALINPVMAVVAFATFLFMVGVSIIIGLFIGAKK